MASFNIEAETLENECFRQILYTDDNLQVILQSLKPEEQVAKEKHEHATQFIRCEKGRGVVIVKNSRFPISDGISVIVPKNTYHTIINLSKKNHLKFYTIYGPPAHESDENEC